MRGEQSGAGPDQLTETSAWWKVTVWKRKMLIINTEQVIVKKGGGHHLTLNRC